MQKIQKILQSVQIQQRDESEMPLERKITPSSPSWTPSPSLKGVLSKQGSDEALPILYLNLIYINS